MILKKFFRTALIPGITALLCIASADAATIINYTTNATGTKFVGGNLTLNSSSGQSASLTFTPNTSSASGVPSNIDLGDFLLSCGTCTSSQTTMFSSFTFDLVVSDTTDGATGEFVGTSAGGTVSSNSSTIQINWSPLQLGPGTSNATTGNFGSTVFSTTSFTGVPAPNSGSPMGDVTVQGTVSSASAPEPATFALLGGALFGVGVIGRKKFFRP